MKSQAINQSHAFPIWRYIALTLAILAIPFTASFITSEVNWTVSDYLAMGGLLFGASMAFELVARGNFARQHRTAVAVVFVLGVLVVWTELAVGIFD